MSLRFVVLITVLLHASFAAARVTLSLFALHEGASPLRVGMLVSLLAVLPAIYSLPAGRWIDQAGVRKPMLLAAVCTLLATLVPTVWPTLGALYAMSLFGSGFMLFHLAVHHLVGTMGGPEDRVRNFSVLALAFATSSFIGPTTAGIAIDQLGHRGAFAVSAGIAAVTLAILLAVKFDTEHHAPAARAAGSGGIMELMRMPMLRRVFVLSGLLSMTWDLFTFVVPIHGNRVGLSASKIGAVLGTFGIAIMVVRLAMPFISKRLSEWKLLTFSIGTSALMFVAFPFAESAALLSALAFVLGLGLGSAQPMIMALLYGLTPPGRGGEAVGVRSLLLNCSQTGIPLLFGALGAALGLMPVFWTMAGLLAAGGCYARSKPA